MKAAVVRNPASFDSIEIVEREQPAPGPGEILVRVAASSLNYHDLAVVNGMIPTADERIPMSDGAGEVLALGEGAEGFAVGGEVVSVFFPNWSDGEGTNARRAGVPGDHADGFAAEYVAAPVRAFTRIPEGWSLAEAATLPCAALTAWNALFTAARIQPGQTVLVQGTGGVSIFALQFAKAAGARVVATSSSEAKLARLRDLGADHVIDYHATEDWGGEAARWAGGEGVDAVIEVGGPDNLAQSIRACRTGGRIALIGVLTGISGEMPTALFMMKKLELYGISVGSIAEQRAMIAAIEANGIRPVIDSHFPLDRLADAFRHQEAGRHFGKIVVDIA
ncbi:MAG: NAD(P)-dependent alcohol dehydrogenase [Sphingomonadaceae bacterium]|nr:NAD(P)-dependent alcohol dehydrogenase [Sphingomonadaceae bacterium]